MKKLLRTLLISFSTLLLSACNSTFSKDWTKGYLEEDSTNEIYTSEMSPLLEIENTNQVYKDAFSYVTFQGKATMYAYGGPKIMEKFDSLWETEVKHAIADVIVTRFRDDLFSLHQTEKMRMGEEYNFDLQLNDLFASVFLNEEEGQYFREYIANIPGTKTKCLFLCEYTVNYYNNDNENVFHFEYGHCLKERRMTDY